MKSFFFTLLLFPFLMQGQPLFISRDKAFSDIDSMNNLIEEVHYNPFIHISQSGYQHRTDQIKRSIGDSISIKQFILKLMELTASFKDAHTGPNFYQTIIKDEYSRKQFLPFKVASGKGYKIFKTDETGRIPRGSEIISINGLKLSTFSRKIHNALAGLPEFRKEMMERLFFSYLFLEGIHSPFHIKYKSGGKLFDIKMVDGISFRDAIKVGIPSALGKNYEFSILNDSIGYLNFAGMSGDWKVLDKFLDSSMQLMRRRNIPVFVIDLRNNSGGNSMLGDLLLSYLTKKNFSMMGKRYWKISDAYKNNLLASGSSSEYIKQPSGSVWEMGDCKAREQLFKNDSIYTGKIFFITGPFTFSSAHLLADAVKHYGLGTLVGEPTGELVNDFGEVYSFELPHSKVRINTTTSFDLGAACNKNLDQAVIPDIIIRNTTNDKIKNIDPVLNYILKLYGKN